MPDIAMCLDRICGLRKGCYRYMAKPSEWQSYGVFYYDAISNTCDDYIELIEVIHREDQR